MKDKIEAFLTAHGAVFSSVFVPWSQHTHDEKQRYGLAYDVTLTQGRRAYTTRYSQGAAYLPSWAHHMTIEKAEACQRESETGLHGCLPILPSVVDVMACLASDASALDCVSFEEWAGDFGYDTDSRKAEGVYNACVACGLALRSMFGDAGLAELREITKDW